MPIGKYFLLLFLLLYPSFCFLQPLTYLLQPSICIPESIVRKIMFQLSLTSTFLSEALISLYLHQSFWLQLSALSEDHPSRSEAREYSDALHGGRECDMQDLWSRDVSTTRHWESDCNHLRVWCSHYSFSPSLSLLSSFLPSYSSPYILYILPSFSFLLMHP